jgi:predicted TPR repeat methyltransferase
MSDDIRTYWNGRIEEWENSAYENSTAGLGIVEKMASRFRGSLRVRMELSLDILRPFLQSKTILDLGCGGGLFCFKMLRAGASRAIGIDFSANAVERANDKAQELGVADRCRFVTGDVRGATLPSADITTGLGLVDYLDKRATMSLVARLATRSFLFSFSERKVSLPALLHVMYLKYQRCPSAFHYSSNEMTHFLKVSGINAFAFVRDKRMLFGAIVHNLTPTTNAVRNQQ